MSNYLVSINASSISKHYFRQTLNLAKFLAINFWSESLLLYLKISNLKNSKKNMNAFVFANGPSLNKIDPLKIKTLQQSGKFDIFGVNSYVSTEFGRVAVPNMYVLSDPAHFGMGTADKNKQREIECSQDVERLSQIEGLTVFVPNWYRNKIKTFSQTIPFCDREILLFKNFSDIRFPRSFCSMTAYKAIQIAIYLGYKSIYIAGFDNNYFKTIITDKANQLWEVDNHFYDTSGKKRKVTPPAYQCSNMAEYLISNAMLFSDLYGFSGCNIFNLIDESLVDAFPKVKSLDVYDLKLPSIQKN